MVDVLEELELDRFAEPLGRLEPVEDDAPGAPREVLIEEAGRAAEDSREVGLPFVPLVGLEVRRGSPGGRRDRSDESNRRSRE